MSGPTVHRVELAGHRLAGHVTTPWPVPASLVQASVAPPSVAPASVVPVTFRSRGSAIGSGLAPRRWISLAMTLAFSLVLALALLAGLGAPTPVQARDAVSTSPVDSLREASRDAGRGSGSPAFIEVDLERLPVQVRQTLALIRSGGPFPYRKDGTVFMNRERLLPARPRGYYTEYTVPTPRARNRGARRIVAGGDPVRTDEIFYTDDHYQSFRRIREPG